MCLCVLKKIVTAIYAWSTCVSARITCNSARFHFPQKNNVSMFTVVETGFRPQTDFLSDTPFRHVMLKRQKLTPERWYRYTCVCVRVCGLGFLRDLSMGLGWLVQWRTSHQTEPNEWPTILSTYIYLHNVLRVAWEDWGVCPRHYYTGSFLCKTVLKPLWVHHM